MSSDAYQCKFTQLKDKKQKMQQNSVARPSPTQVDADREAKEPMDSPEYREMRQQESVRIRSSREIRIQFSQEEHGHFDTITNPSHKHSSPKTREFTPSRNMSPEVLEKLRCFNVLEDEKQTKTPLHRLQDMET